VHSLRCATRTARRAAGEGAPDADVAAERAQRRALLARLRLPLSHFPTAAAPLPRGLLAAAALCCLPQAAAYELLLRAPAAAEPVTLTLVMQENAPSLENYSLRDRGLEVYLPGAGRCERRAGPGRRGRRRRRGRGRGGWQSVVHRSGVAGVGRHGSQRGGAGRRLCWPR